MSLSSMLSGNWFEALATATPATSATDRGEGVGSVATVATVAVANPPSGKAANDPADIFTARLALFTGRGLNADAADDLAQRLMRRDLEQDDRRVCLECRHLSGDVDRRRCAQWRKLWIGDASMPADLVATLQRCAAFSYRLKVGAFAAIEPVEDNHDGIDNAKD